MRIVLLILLLLINTLSLPLQAMGMLTMPANITCDMQDMPCYSKDNNSQDDMDPMQHANSSLQHANNSANNSDCSNMDNCNDCNISCLSAFINFNHKLLHDSHKQSNSLSDELYSPRKQHPDNLYRPPLIS